VALVVLLVDQEVLYEVVTSYDVVKDVIAAVLPWRGPPLPILIIVINEVVF
jgi:hypothetical protein